MDDAMHLSGNAELFDLGVDDEFSGHVEEFGDEAIAREVVEADHEDALKSGRKPIVRFYIPSAYRWEAIRNHSADGRLGEFVTEAMRKVADLNPRQC